MPERRVMGMKIVVIRVRRLTTRFVLLAAMDIRVFIMDRYISMKLDIISRYISASSKNEVKPQVSAAPEFLQS